MLIPILLALVVLAGLALSQTDSHLIERRPYNNRYNDASGSREDHLG
jgi:hypothetical protein